MVDFSPFRFLAVIALFVGHIVLLAPIFDRLRKRAESSKSADRDLASLNAELLARRLGEAVLTCILVVARISGLIVMGLLIAFVYDGHWIALPLAILITLLGGMIGNWASSRLYELKGGLLSKLL